MGKRDGLRLNLQFSEESGEKLEYLAAELETTKTGVMRKALMLLSVVVRAHKDGKRVLVEHHGETARVHLLGVDEEL